MFKFHSTLSVISAALIALTISSANSREGNQISIVGSSTVYPFATVVAETFGRANNGF